MPITITIKKKPEAATSSELPECAKRQASVGGKPPNAKRQALIDLVSEIVDKDPLQIDGHKWAARTQDWYALELGISVATVRNYIKAPPFVRDRVKVGEQTLAILRIGEPDAKSTRHIANTFKLIFLDHLKFLEQAGWFEKALEIDGAPKQKPKKAMKARASISAHEYGCLIGLAGELPGGEEVKLFRFVLRNWSLFMSAVDCKISNANTMAELDGKALPYRKRYYNFPSIPVMRKFADCILEAYHHEHPPTLAA